MCLRFAEFIPLKAGLTQILSALSDCKAVISHGMGRRIYDDLKEAGIEVFITDEMDVQKAFDLFMTGELIDRPELGCSHRHECE